MVDVNKSKISELTKDLKKLQKEAQGLELPKDWFWHKKSVEMLIHIQNGLENDIEKIKENQFHVKEYVDKLKVYLDRLKTEIGNIRKKNITVNKTKLLSEAIRRDMGDITYLLRMFIPELEILEKHYSTEPYLEKKKILIKIGVNFALNPLLTEMLIENWDLVEEIIKLDENDYKYYYLWEIIHHFDKFIHLSLSEQEISALRKKTVGNKTAEQIYRDPEFMDNLKDFLHKMYSNKKSLELQGKQNFRHVLMFLEYIIYGGTKGQHLGERICKIAIPDLSNIFQTGEDLKYFHDFCSEAFKIDKMTPMRVTEVLSTYKEVILKGVVDWKSFISIMLKNSLKYPETYNIFDPYRYFFKVFISGRISWKEFLSMVELSDQVAVKRWGKKDLSRNYADFKLIIVDVFEQIMSLSKTIPLRKLFELICDFIALSEKKKMIGIKSKQFVSSGLRMVANESLSLKEFYQGTKKIDRKLIHDEEDFFRLVSKYGEQLLKRGISWEEILAGMSIFSFHQLNSKLIEMFLDDITPQFWDKLKEFSLIFSSSKHNSIKMAQILEHLNNDSKIFLQYLIMFRPNQVLDVFEMYVLVKNLKIDYNQEMKLFLKIASPIALKINNFSELTSILLPIKDLSAQRRNKFTSFLDSSLLVFQGMRYKFTEALSQTPGFENVEQFSFVELVYIYLKHSENPDLKVNKIKKKLAKIKKNASKIIRIVDNKKDIKDINETDYNILDSSLNKVAQMFFDPLVALYLQSSKDKLVETIQKMFNLNNPKQIGKRISNPNFQNAIIIYNRIRTSNRDSCKQLCFKLIQEYLLFNTYPFKAVPQAYPWNDEKNQAWLKKSANPSWLRKFEKEYKITKEDLEGDNTEERIKHHFDQSKEILNSLGVTLTNFTLERIEEQYKILTKKSEEKDLLNDLKVQINALKSLFGQEEEKKGIIGGKITITSEFDPLEILQMGNYVNGSCLNTYGANYWSTIINASEVNKRVLWAKNHKGEVIARLLIGVDENKRIVKFPIYYSTIIKLDRFFDYYIIELAKKCRFGINGDSTKVLRLFDGGWYTDGTITIGEELKSTERYRRTG
jgi:hypothetical protein